MYNKIDLIEEKKKIVDKIGHLRFGLILIWENKCIQMISILLI